MPLTQDRPKGMVALEGRPLLRRQIEVLRGAGIDDITLVGGYLIERLDELGCRVLSNPAFSTTNMVESLMVARELFDGAADVLMCYGDIVYEPRVLSAALSQHGDVVVTADRGWRTLWSARMEDYASDVESFRLGADGRVAELGRRPGSLDEVQAQYIGLVRFPAAVHSRLLALYDGLDRKGTFDGQPFARMYMTSFVQQMIDAGWNVRPALIEHGWLEVDSVEDLRRYRALAEAGQLDPICRLEPLPSARELARGGNSPVHVPPDDDVLDIVDLARRVATSASPSAAELEWLDRLARKIEIGGRLHRCYGATRSAPLEEPPIRSQDAGALLAAYVVAFDATRDLRHLNTVLKAIDGTLREPLPAFGAELAKHCETRLQAHD